LIVGELVDDEHHYAIYIYFLVAIDPEKLPARLNMELFKALQENVAANIFIAPASYDGRKNFFSMYKLNLGPTDSREVRVPTCTNYIPHLRTTILFIQFNVSLPRQGPPPAPGARPPKVYKMKVTYAAEINTEYDPLIFTHDLLSDLFFF
jgi:eukaryotic translation initiation factor 2C